MRYGILVTAQGVLLTAEVASFLESGLVLFVATRDAALLPSGAPAAGLRVGPDGRHVTVFLPVRPAARVIEDLRANGELAVTASRPIDYRTLQLKGRVVRLGPAPEEDAAFVRAYRASFAAQLGKVGWVPAQANGIVSWPCVAAELAVRELFEQTPGPRAGARLDPA